MVVVSQGTVGPKRDDEQRSLWSWCFQSAAQVESLHRHVNNVQSKISFGLEALHNECTRSQFLGYTENQNDKWLILAVVP